MPTRCGYWAILGLVLVTGGCDTRRPLYFKEGSGVVLEKTNAVYNAQVRCSGSVFNSKRFSLEISIVNPDDRKLVLVRDKCTLSIGAGSAIKAEDLATITGVTEIGPHSDGHVSLCLMPDAYRDKFTYRDVHSARLVITLATEGGQETALGIELTDRGRAVDRDVPGK